MLLFKILLITLTILPMDSRWQRVKTDEDLTFLFPNNPQKLEKTVNGIPSTIYQTKNLTCVFGIVCSDMSSKKIDLTAETALILYNELKTGSLEIPTATLEQEITVPHESIFIKEIEYSIIKGKFEMTYFKRFIFREKFVYQISIGGRSRHLEIILREKEIFFNSLTFPKESTNKNLKNYF